MALTISRKQVLALSKLDFAGRKHLERLDLIARTLGLRNQGTMMALFNRATAGTESHGPVKYPDDVVEMTPRRTPTTLSAPDATSAISRTVSSITSGYGRMQAADAVANLSRGRNGLIVIAGRTSSGKSTVMRRAEDRLRLMCGRHQIIDTGMIMDEQSAAEALRLSRRGVIMRKIHGGSTAQGLQRLRMLAGDDDAVSTVLIGVIYVEHLADRAEQMSYQCERFDGPDTVMSTIRGLRAL